MTSQAALTAQEIDELTAYLQREAGKTGNTSEFLQLVLGGHPYTEYTFKHPRVQKILIFII